MSMNYGKTSYALISTTTQVKVSEITLLANVNIPSPPKGIVILAITSNHQYQNKVLINELLKNQFGVIEINLFTKQELLAEKNSSNLNIITQRLIAVTRWVKKVFAEGDMGIGLWGFEKGATAVLKASTELDSIVNAFVCSEDGTHSYAEGTSPSILAVNELNDELVKLNKLASANTQTFEKLFMTKNQSSSYNTSDEMLEPVQWICERISCEPHLVDALV